MKETTGELNMTLITVTIIAMLVAFFYLLIWPSIKGTLNRTTRCNVAVCDNSKITNGMVKCIYTPKNSGDSVELDCVFKG